MGANVETYFPEFLRPHLESTTYSPRKDRNHENSFCYLNHKFQSIQNEPNGRVFNKFSGNRLPNSGVKKMKLPPIFQIVNIKKKYLYIS